jgi:pilus assembly protein Flp/PilA
VLAIRQFLRTLGANHRGATAIEYGLIAALIAVAIVSSLKSLGGGAGGMWSNLSNIAQNAM